MQQLPRKRLSTVFPAPPPDPEPEPETAKIRPPSPTPEPLIISGPKPRNPLQTFMQTKTDLPLHKWLHYFDIYHQYFERYQGLAGRFLEIGVQGGGSMQMWRDYFGPDMNIFGMDIDPKCATLGLEEQDPRLKIVIGDQANRSFLRNFAAANGPFDMVVDDGGHLFDQQIASFEELFPYVRPGGVYLVEDTHTSYWPEFQGGANNPHTFVNYSKRLIEDIHAWHIKGAPISKWTNMIESIAFADSIVVFRKKLNLARRPPQSEKWKSGKRIEVGPFPPNQNRK